MSQNAPHGSKPSVKTKRVCECQWRFLGTCVAWNSEGVEDPGNDLSDKRRSTGTAPSRDESATEDTGCTCESFSGETLFIRAAHLGNVRRNLTQDVPL